MIRKFSVALAVCGIALLIAFMPASEVQALPSHEIIYTVYYSCIVGPPYTDPVGEWTRGCNGSWSGWGWEPGHECTRTEVSYGDECYREPRVY